MTDKKLNGEVSSSKENNFRLFELVIELLKVILWPFIIIFLLISLQQPISDLSESLPYLITRSSEISVAGISLKVDKKLQTTTKPQLRVAASNLSKYSLIYLLDIGKYGSGGGISSKSEYLSDKEKKSLNELVNRKLAFSVKETANKDGYNIKYGATELGVEVYNLILNILIEQFINKG